MRQFTIDELRIIRDSLISTWTKLTQANEANGWEDQERIEAIRKVRVLYDAVDSELPEGYWRKQWTRTSTPPEADGHVGHRRPDKR